jgi:uncharacterized protein
MKTLWLEDRITYDGSQLRAHWALRRCGIAGDALVAFRGPCAVAREEIADLADVDGPGIAADDMVHFLWESFTAADLLLAVHRLRLLAAQAHECLLQLAPAVRVERDGDDLFVDGGKLSIGIASVSAVSSLLHFGINVADTGAPVRVTGLQQLGVDPSAFARALLDRVAAEQDSIQQARAKVRARGEWQP